MMAVAFWQFLLSVSLWHNIHISLVSLRVKNVDLYSFKWTFHDGSILAVSIERFSGKLWVRNVDVF